MNDDSMLSDFVIEAEEIMEEAEVSLLDLDKGGDFRQNYNAIFRAFHSLKGAAGMFGLNELQAHVHKLETLLESLKDNDEIEKDLIDYFLSGIDAAKSIMNGEEVDFLHIANKDLDNGGVEVNASVDSKNVERIREELSDRSEKINKGFVYIVDDEPEIVRIIDEVLSEVGFVTKGFTSAETLLNSVVEDRPDLILSDIKMPGITGDEMLSRLREIEPDMPLVFISGAITREVMLSSLEKGVTGFIEKPIDDQKLINTVNIVLSTRKAVKLLNRSINYILYQFSDLDEFLKVQGKEIVRVSLREELENILEQRKLLKKSIYKV